MHYSNRRGGGQGQGQGGCNRLPEGLWTTGVVLRLECRSGLGFALKLEYRSGYRSGLGFALKLERRWEHGFALRLERRWELGFGLRLDHRAELGNGRLLVYWLVAVVYLELLG